MNDLGIVLVEPRNPMNVGAVARIMHNFGLQRLVLVRPQVSVADEKAIATAHQSGHILEQARIVDSLAEACADAEYTIATTNRDRRENRPVLTVRELPRLLETQRVKRLDLVFGSETTGLTNEDIYFCDNIATIPTAHPQTALNLAQAVAVFAYELSNVPQSDTVADLAIKSEKMRLRAAIQEVLDASRFRSAHTTEHFVSLLLRSLNRAMLEKRDINAWLKYHRHLLATLKPKD
jgi:tRNA/rRNA methyltransferase